MTQSAGITHVAHNLGIYVLDFGAPVTGHLILASTALADDVAFRGAIGAAPCVEGIEGAPAPCLFGGTNPNRAEVLVMHPNGVATENHSFYVAVI